MNDTLHSSDQTLFDFLLQSTTDTAALRQRIHTMYLYYLYIYLMTVIFAYAAKVALTALRTQPRNVVCWCVSVQSVVGVISNIIGIYGLLLPHGPTCQLIVINGIVAFSVSILCSNLVLLLKAYSATQQYRPLLLVGAVLVLLGPVTMLVSVLGLSTTYISHSGICIFRYPVYFPWVKLGVDALVNGLFLGTFLRVVWQQYRRKGAECWRWLACDGTATMGAVVAVNLICAVGVGSRVAGDFSVVFIEVDHVVTTVLLAGYAQAVHKTMQRYSLHPIGPAQTSEQPSARVTPADEAPIQCTSIIEEELYNYRSLY